MNEIASPQWIAKQQLLARQAGRSSKVLLEPVGQQKSAQRHKGTNVPFCGVPAGTEDDRLRGIPTCMSRSGHPSFCLPTQPIYSKVGSHCVSHSNTSDGRRPCASVCVTIYKQCHIPPGRAERGCGTRPRQGGHEDSEATLIVASRSPNSAPPEDVRV
jgi:hypothetical protein